VGRSAFDLLIFIGKRLLQLIPVLLGVIILAFFITHVTAVNVCNQWYQHADKATIDRCNAQFAQPVVVQFFQYFWQLLSGNLGQSQYGVAVAPYIAQYLPATVELVLAALFLMIFIGIPLGVIAAQSSGRWADHFVRIFYLSGWATPTYLGAVVGVLFVAPALGLPTQGMYSSPNVPFHQWTHFSLIDPLLGLNPAWELDAMAHLFMPAAVLAFINMGIATRMTRSSMLEVLPLDFVKSARMKGLSEFWVLYKHALRNALITTVTVLGVTAGGLLAGTVVIEEVFGWPGIGEYAYQSMGAGGYPVNYDAAIAVVAIFAVGVVIANLIADVLYGVLDPRVDWR